MKRKESYSPLPVQYLDQSKPLASQEIETQWLLDCIWERLVILKPGTGSADRGVSIPSFLLENLGFVEGIIPPPKPDEKDLSVEGIIPPPKPGEKDLSIDAVTVRVDISEGAPETCLPVHGRLEITKTYQSGKSEGSFVPKAAGSGEPITMRIDSTKTERYLLTRSIGTGKPRYLVEMWKRKTVTHAHVSSEVLENVDPALDFEQVEPQAVNLNTLAAIIDLSRQGWTI